MKLKWNDDWRDELRLVNEPCYNRLCECRNKKSDLEIMAQLMQKYNPLISKTDCLNRVLEWVGDWNGQFAITDLTKEEYNNILLFM